MSSFLGYNPATVSTFSSNSYHYVTLTISGSIHSLYLDGSMVAQNTSAGNIFSAYTYAIQNMYIGCAGDLSYGFNGYIDDFKVWNRVLSPADIFNISKLSGAYIYLPFTTNTNNIGTSGSTASVSGSCTITQYLGKSCVYINNTSTTNVGGTENPGIGNYITVPFLSDKTTSFTFGFWVNAVAGYFNPSGICNGNNQILNVDIGLSTNLISYYDITGSAEVASTSSYDYTSNWVHITCTRPQNGSYCNLYVNGVLIPNTTSVSVATAYAPSTIIIGGGVTTSLMRGFRGYLRHFFAYTRVLNSTEIQTIYNTTQ